MRLTRYEKVVILIVLLFSLGMIATVLLNEYLKTNG